MPLLRLLLAAVAILALGAFTDASNKFAVDFPDGWSAVSIDKDGNVQSDAPDTGGASAWCRANTVSLESLKNIGQAELNAKFAAPFDRQTWAGFYSIDAAKISLSDGGARVVDGRMLQTVTLTLAPEVMGTEGTAWKARFGSYFLPGHTVNVGCFTTVDAYDNFKNTFEAVVASLKPL